MKILIEKEIKDLYYLGSGIGREERSWNGKIRREEGYKKFVRVSYNKKDGSLGSKLYCCSMVYGLLFDDYNEALKLKNKYNNKNEEVKKLNLRIYKERIGKNQVSLKPVIVEGVNCYEIC